MKKYLAILLTLVMVACEAKKPDEGGGTTTPPVIGDFISNAQGLYNLDAIKAQLVGTSGNIINTADDAVMYEFKKEYDGYSALYLNTATSKFNVVEYDDTVPTLIFTGDFATAEEGDTAVDSGIVIDPSPGAPVVTPAIFELADGVYDLPNDRQITNLNIDGKPSFSEVRNTILYTYVKAVSLNQGIFISGAGQFVGIQKSDTTPPTLSLYAQNKDPRDSWWSAGEVVFTEEHLYTTNPDEPILPEGTPAFIMVAYGLSPITVGDVTYTMDKNGDLSVDGTITYVFNSSPDSATAVYTTVDGLGFLGAKIVDGAFALYQESKATPWATIEEVLYTDRHRVAFKPAFVIAAQAKGSFTIFGAKDSSNNPDLTAYTMDDFGDILNGTTVVYTHIGTDGDTLADYAVTAVVTEGEPKFVGFAIEAVVTPPPVEPEARNTATSMYLYRNNKRGPWLTQEEIQHIEAHQVGLKSAFVTAAQLKQPFTIFGAKTGENPDLTAYTMNDLGDILNGTSVVYTYDGEHANATNAYYIPVSDDTKFAGFGIPVAGAGANEMHLYKERRTDYFDAREKVIFLTSHLVGDLSTVAFQDWDNYGIIDAEISALHSFGTASFGNTIWIVGGQTGSRINTVYKSIDAGKNWEKIVPTGLVAVQTPALIATSENDLLLMGGNYGSTQARTFTSADGGTTWIEGARFDGGTTGNNDGTTDKPRRVNGPTLVIHKGEQYLLGGVGKYWENFVWKSSDNVNWTRMTSTTESGGVAENSFTTRGYHAAVSFNNDLYVMGGQNAGGAHKDVWKSTDGGANWTQIQADAPWGERTGLQAVVYENEIYVVGGTSSTDPATLIWKSANGVDWTAVPISTTEIGSRESFGAAAVTHTDNTDPSNPVERLDFVIFGGKNKNDTWRTGNYINPK